MPLNDAIRARIQRAAAGHRRATLRAAATRAELNEAMRAGRDAGLSVRDVAAIAEVSIGTVQAAERGGKTE